MSRPDRSRRCSSSGRPRRSSVEIPSGAWADTIDRRHLLVLSALIYGVGFSSWMLLPTYAGFALGFMLWGLSSAIMSGTFESLIYDELSERGVESEYPRLIGWAHATAMVGQPARDRERGTLARLGRLRAGRLDVGRDHRSAGRARGDAAGFDACPSAERGRASRGRVPRPRGGRGERTARRPLPRHAPRRTARGLHVRAGTTRRGDRRGADRPHGVRRVLPVGRASPRRHRVDDPGPDRDHRGRSGRSARLWPDGRRG